MIKNIIFDQGGILLNVKYQLTSQAFKALGAKNFDELYSQDKQHQLFDLFDKGQISSVEFRKTLKDHLNISNASDQDFDIAWNAMLLDMPIRRLHYIAELKENYFVAILSNANDIHMTEAEKIFKKFTGRKSIAHYFHKMYYSHLCGFRKPDAESFQIILDENKLQPEETLFIDDSVQHIDAAQALGINTLHLTDECITDVLPETLEAFNA